MADSLDGTTALVTGATNGIGRVTAGELARRGARVLFVARDRARGEATLAEIREASGGRPTDLLLADLSSQREVRRLAQEVRERTPRLDLLVNNAGAIFDERAVSADGLEMTFALNHLAYFLLTLELLPILEEGSASRIVNVSSVAHERGSIDFDDLQAERGYSMWRAYQQSKLANVLFTRELARRLGGRGVTTNALHPGVIASGFGRNGRGFFSRFVALGAPLLASPERGARTTIHVATAPELAGVTGRYFSGCREKTPSKAAQDDAAALRLWQISEELALSSTRLPPP
jgi:retinol dehydrogenase-12